jgi:hypothetical protein
VAGAGGVRGRVGDDVERRDVEERQRRRQHVVLGRCWLSLHRGVEVEEMVV